MFFTMKVFEKMLAGSQQERGFALVLAIFVVAGVMILGISIMTVSMLGSESAGYISRSQQSFQVADGAAEVARESLKSYDTPPEKGAAFNSEPFSQPTAWNSDFNSENVPFPQNRYQIEALSKLGVSAPVKKGERLTIGTDYHPTVWYWHMYKITAQARDGHSAYLNQIDREIVLKARKMYKE